MWSVVWDGPIEEVNDGSGFVRRRLVVRRAEDSFLRETDGIKLEDEGRRKGKIESGRVERETDILLLWIGLVAEHEQISRQVLKNRLNVGRDSGWILPVASAARLNIPANSANSVTIWVETWPTL